MLASCSDSAEGEPEVPEESTSASPAPDATSGFGPVEVPGTQAGEATSWVLDQLALAEGPDAEEAAERFGETFLAEVPAEQVSIVFDQLRAYGPFELVGFDGVEESSQATLTGGDGSRLLLHVTTEEDGRIVGLFLEDVADVPEIGSLEDLDSAFAELDAESSYLVAEVSGGICEPIVSDEPDVSRPIGSVFKVYVLEAVRQAVDDGELSWDDVLVLTDDLRSLPSGVLQEEPAGTEVTVREAAEGMISISDNTATDMLIDAVGRERVQEAFVDLGHGSPEDLEPFLTTREMFQLAFTDADLTREWAEADVTERAAILADLPGGDIELDESLLTTPVWQADLDWFATSEDLCQAFATLHDTERPGSEVVREITSITPGIASGDGWEFIGFKGGSSIGEIAGAWYLEDGEGQAYVITAQFAAEHAGGVPDAAWFFDVAGQIAGLIE